MALGTNGMTHTTADKFIPDVWLDEIRFYLRANLIAANLIKTIYFQGAKGDVLHIPDLSGMTANDKSANTQVTLQTFTETEFTVTIDKHKEASFVIEDIVNVQSKYDLRSNYTASAGYGVASKIDSDIWALEASLTTRVIGSNGSTAYSANGADLTEAGIRQLMETLDTVNVPQMDRFMALHPAQKNVLLAISRFTEYQMVGNGGSLNPIQTAKFGEIFGMPVYFTTQAPVVNTSYHANFCGHKDGLLIAMQMSPRVQAQYKQEYLGWLFTVDTIYKPAIYRQNHMLGVYTAI